MHGAVAPAALRDRGIDARHVECAGPRLNGLMRDVVERVSAAPRHALVFALNARVSTRRPTRRAPGRRPSAPPRRGDPWVRALIGAFAAAAVVTSVIDGVLSRAGANPPLLALGLLGASVLGVPVSLVVELRGLLARARADRAELAAVV